jgi:hypothetical protein
VAVHDGLPGFLGIDHSLTGRRWRQRPGDERAGNGCFLYLGLPLKRFQ